MAKLSKYQEEILNEAKREIDEARACKDVYEYVIKHSNMQDEYKYNLDKYPKVLKNYTRWFEAHRVGIVMVNARVTTLQKLEKLGLIKILKLDNSRKVTGSVVIDTIQLLNY